MNIPIAFGQVDGHKMLSPIRRLVTSRVGSNEIYRWVRGKKLFKQFYMLVGIDKTGMPNSFTASKISVFGCSCNFNARKPKSWISWNNIERI